MHLRWTGLLFSSVCLALATIGCSSDNPLGRHALSGTVTLNGQPLQSGSIEFSPLVEGGVSSGAVIESGAYSITADQGLPAGKYRVAIVDSPPAPPLPAGHMPGDPLPPAPKAQVPAEWNTASQQTIEITKDGPFKFNFDITTKKA